MQETPVGWEPMYEGRLPWFTKVFVVYLALVLFTSVFRAIRLMWHLRGLRKWSRKHPPRRLLDFRLRAGRCRTGCACARRFSPLAAMIRQLGCAGYFKAAGRRGHGVLIRRGSGSGRWCSAVPWLARDLNFLPDHWPQMLNLSGEAISDTGLLIG